MGAAGPVRRRPAAWEHGGAVFTDDVHPYELLKLRLLNGTHSLIAYLGALDGQPTIPDATAQPFIADAARRVLVDDYLPSITVPPTSTSTTTWPNCSLAGRTPPWARHAPGRLRRLGQTRANASRNRPCCS